MEAERICRRRFLSRLCKKTVGGILVLTPFSWASRLDIDGRTHHRHKFQENQSRKAFRQIAGWRREPCPRCDSGQVRGTCAMCDGTGQSQTGNVCQGCGGYGWRWKWCSVCDGTGSIWIETDD